MTAKKIGAPYSALRDRCIDSASRAAARSTKQLYVIPIHGIALRSSTRNVLLRSYPIAARYITAAYMTSGRIAYCICTMK
jgi:hypothetical protein